MDPKSPKVASTERASHYESWIQLVLALEPQPVTGQDSMGKRMSRRARTARASDMVLKAQEPIRANRSSTTRVKLACATSALHICQRLPCFLSVFFLTQKCLEFKAHGLLSCVPETWEEGWT